MISSAINVCVFVWIVFFFFSFFFFYSLKNTLNWCFIRFISINFIFYINSLKYARGKGVGGTWPGQQQVWAFNEMLNFGSQNWSNCLIQYNFLLCTLLYLIYFSFIPFWLQWFLILHGRKNLYVASIGSIQINKNGTTISPIKVCIFFFSFFQQGGKQVSFYFCFFFLNK